MKKRVSNLAGLLYYSKELIHGNEKEALWHEPSAPIPTSRTPLASIKLSALLTLAILCTLILPRSGLASCSPLITWKKYTRFTSTFDNFTHSKWLNARVRSIHDTVLKLRAGLELHHCSQRPGFYSKCKLLTAATNKTRNRLFKSTAVARQNVNIHGFNFLTRIY